MKMNDCFLLAFGVTTFTLLLFLDVASVVQACSSKFPITVTTDKEDITSPNYPSFYPNNKECRWLISAPLDKLIQFKLKVYDLAQPADYIEVRDGVNESAVVLKNFTEWKPFIMRMWRTSSGHFLWMKFKSDGVHSSKGFQIDIRFVNKPKACLPLSPEVRTTKKQELMVEYYGRAFYPNNQECKWLFKSSQPDKLIIVNVRLFQDSLMQGDYIEFRDGMNENATLLKTLTIKTERRRPIPVASSGRFLWMKFKSDKEFTGEGFQVFYSLGNIPRACSPSENFTTGKYRRLITNPFRSYPYNKHIKCTWLVSTNHDKLIVLKLRMFDFSGPGHYIEILDGMDKNAPLLHNFTSKPDFYNQTWRSSGPFLTINFVSNGFLRLDFIIYVEHLDKPIACIDPQGIAVDEFDIVSPFYPSFYPNNQQCTWIIMANKPDHVVAFRMKHLDLVQPGDYVEVRDGIDDNAVLLQIFTSKSNLSDELRTSSGRFMRVKFKSDHQHTAKGFRMFIQFINKTFADVPTSQATPSFTSKDIPASTSGRVSNATSNLAGDMIINNNKNKRQIQLPTSATIGIGVSIGVIVLLVLLFIIFFKKRKNQLKNRYPDSKDPWEISLSRVELVEELGHGAFGRVWKGNMESNEVDRTNNVTQSLIQNKQAKKKDVVVAVKMLHDGATSDEKQEFLREIEFMKNVGYHRNIISMVACCTKEEQVFFSCGVCSTRRFAQLSQRQAQTDIRQVPSVRKQTNFSNKLR